MKTNNKMMNYQISTHLATFHCLPPHSKPAAWKVWSKLLISGESWRARKDSYRRIRRWSCSDGRLSLKLWSQRERTHPDLAILLQCDVIYAACFRFRTKIFHRPGKRTPFSMNLTACRQGHPPSTGSWLLIEENYWLLVFHVNARK